MSGRRRWCLGEAGDSREKLMMEKLVTSTRTSWNCKEDHDNKKNFMAVWREVYDSRKKLMNEERSWR